MQDNGEWQYIIDRVLFLKLILIYYSRGWNETILRGDILNLLLLLVKYINIYIYIYIYIYIISYRILANDNIDLMSCKIFPDLISREIIFICDSHVTIYSTLEQV